MQNIYNHINATLGREIICLTHTKFKKYFASYDQKVCRNW